MKTAQKTLAAILALLAIAFLAACSSEADDADDTVTTSDLAGTTWTGSYEGDTVTLNFGSNETVTVFEGEDDEGGSYTYTVSGSEVILYYNGREAMRLTYSSGQLIYGMIFTATRSVSSISNLAGTTWTASYEGETFTLVFESDKTATMFEGEEDDEGESYTYTVSGSTVTLYDDEDYEFDVFTYSSGQIISGIIFTKS